jgi:peptidoglycan/LPS O-acetylase OafA/YrhL
LHGLLPDRFLPYSDYAFIGQAWSISLEWQFYLVAPAFFAMLRYGRKSGLLVALVGVLAAYYLLRWRGGYGFLPLHAPYFLLGAASYFLWKCEGIFRSLPASILAGLMPTLTTLSLLICPVPVTIWIATLLSVIIVSQADRGKHYSIESWVVATLRVRPLRWLGRVSYSVYLIHMFPLFMGMHLAQALALSKAEYLLFLMLFVVTTTLVLAHFSFKWIERPGMQLGAEWARRMRKGAEQLSPPKATESAASGSRGDVGRN